MDNHRITLEDVLDTPRMISVIASHVKNGRVKDENLNVWLVGQENRPDGYKIASARSVQYLAVSHIFTTRCIPSSIRFASLLAHFSE